MGSSPPTAGAAVVAAVAAGGVPGRLSGRGTRAGAVVGAAAWSSADRPAALDAREAVADPDALLFYNDYQLVFKEQRG